MPRNGHFLVPRSNLNISSNLWEGLEVLRYPRVSSVTVCQELHLPVPPQLPELCELELKLGHTKAWAR